MSGFSPEWLALREPVDHRSRDPGLARRLGAARGARQSLRVVDLGCGAGSNIRATSRLLGPEQHWTLVDYDARLLDAARHTLAGWGDTAETQGDALRLGKEGRRIHVTFRQCDLMRDLDAALVDGPDLVTASALFDLCSAPFIERLASAVSARRCAFYTVLTYDGRQAWTPAHPADGAMTAAFHHHQTSDKGFGAAAGPGAPAALAAAFRNRGYAVHEGDSPWRLAGPDAPLVADLASGYAAAVGETGLVAADVIADWSRVTRTGAVVGHLDTLALPPG